MKPYSGDSGLCEGHYPNDPAFLRESKLINARIEKARHTIEHGATKEERVAARWALRNENAAMELARCRAWNRERHRLHPPKFIEPMSETEGAFAGLFLIVGIPLCLLMWLWGTVGAYVGALKLLLQ